MKRRIIPLLAAALALLCLCVPVLAAVDLNDPQFVVDDAGVLSPEMEEKIVQANESLYYDCSGAEFVVVTVKYPPSGLDQEEFAKKIFDSWKIGDAQEDNGTLLVLYTEADDFWLECGRGVYDSPYVDEIADLVGDNSDFYKAILKDQDEKAVSILLNGLTSWYKEYYGAPSQNGSSSAPSHTSSGSSGSGNAFRGLLVLIGLILLIVIITSPLRCNRRWGHWGVWPFYYVSPWWPTRIRRPSSMARRPTTYHRKPTPPRPPRPPFIFSNRPPYNYSGRPSSNYGKPPSSGTSHSSHSSSFGSSHSSHSSSSGFSHSSHSSHSSGHSGGFGGRPGGGGRSGGGFGHR